MYLDDSNSGGGEPHFGHGPAISITETVFCEVALALPGFDGLPADSDATFGIAICEHGSMIVAIRGVVIAPLPRLTSFRHRASFAIRYLFGRITSLKPETADA